MTDEPKYRDEEWLREQYVNRERSTTDIADECGCAYTTISRWLKRFDVEVRKPKAPTDERLTDKTWLQEQYVSKRRSSLEIADECGCDHTTALRWLKKHGIKTRDSAEVDDRLNDPDWLKEQYIENQRSAAEIANECGCSPSTVYRRVENWSFKKGRGPNPHPRLADRDWLKRKYIDEKLTTVDIAEKINSSPSLVSDWLKKHGIETRSSGKSGGRSVSDQRLKDADWLRKNYVEKEQTCREIAEKCGCSPGAVSHWLDKNGIDARKGNTRLYGEQNPNWNGGRFPYGPGWNEHKRQNVRDRDRHTCQDPRCSVTQDEHLDQYGEKLHVHHLQKARDVDDPEERNATENLITLCRDCHRRWEKMSEAGLVPEVIPND